MLIEEPIPRQEGNPPLTPPWRGIRTHPSPLPGGEQEPTPNPSLEGNKNPPLTPPWRGIR